MANVFVVQASHHYVPGTVAVTCATRRSADDTARTLLNLIRYDSDLPPWEGDWEDGLGDTVAHLKSVGYAGGGGADVWITETPLMESGR